MKRSLILLPILLVAMFPVACAAIQSPATKWTDVFTRGEGDYHTYRIPAIIGTQNGTLLAFCEGRKSGASDTGNIDLLVRRSLDGGASWEKSIVIWDDQNNTCGNPCPVVDQATGTIWLLMTWNLGNDHESKIKSGESQDVRHAFVTRSDDDGKSWATPEKISDQVRKPHWRWYATGPGNAIQLTRGKHQGRLLIPANHSDHSEPGKHPMRSHVFWSDDHGKSWTLGGVQTEKTNESAVVELADGSILQSMRSYYGENTRAAAISHDAGATFDSVYLDQALTTPVCQGNMIRYSWPGSSDVDQPLMKSRILFSSPLGEKRENLHVWLSYDEAKTWAIKKQIYAGGAAYSNVIALPDNKFGVLFEKDGYKTISFATFTMKWLETE